MDYNKINKNSIKIIEILIYGKAYFNEIHEKTGIKSKNNLLKNLNNFVEARILLKEEKKANTFFSINYSNSISVAIINLINSLKFEKLAFNIKKSIIECIFKLKPKTTILFGSYAKNNYKKESDIDLLFFDSIKEKREELRDISKSYGVQINATFLNFGELDLQSEAIKHIFKTGYPINGAIYFYNEFKKI
ncbi:MAG: nucleotidyltransferase domain-containing protein [Nanoarchaeota archaeon]